GGSSLPGVRVELNPNALNHFGIGLEQVRATLSAANANAPKGHFEGPYRLWQIGVNDQLFKASEYAPLIVGYQGGRAVRVDDVADVVDSVENLLNSGYMNGKPS